MKRIFLISTLFLLALSCSKDDNSATIPTNNYDRTALLTNWADNIIVPSYSNLEVKLASLESEANFFAVSPTVGNLQTLRTSWLEAYKAYQYVSMYNFGKAEEINFKEKTNTYPTNVAGINANITSGTYNFSLLSQFDKQGLPAVDYLINGLGASDVEIVAFYSTNINASKYKRYLTDLVSQLKSNAFLVLNNWNTTYRNAYVANNGNTVNSGVNITTNNFVKNLEKDIRTGKIGIPAGIFSSGTKYPEKVEGFYKNDISKILAIEAIKASQDFFNGKSFNSTATGPGLKTFLDFLNTVRNGQKLSDIINNQYNAILAETNGLSASFSQQVTTNNAKMITVFDTMQQNVVYTKLDMMQALNITPDYVDADGD